MMDINKCRLHIDHSADNPTAEEIAYFDKHYPWLKDFENYVKPKYEPEVPTHIHPSDPPLACHRWRREYPTYHKKNIEGWSIEIHLRTWDQKKIDRFKRHDFDIVNSNNLIESGWHLGVYYCKN